MNLAVAGFRHSHVYTLIKWAREQGLNIIAAYEKDKESIFEAQSEGIKITHTDYNEMLNDKDIDIVAIADYYSARGNMVINALRAGKHVIADKPLCTSLEELDTIEKLSAEKGLRIGLMLDLRYMSASIAAHDFIRSGGLGRVNNISFGGQHALNYGVRPGWYFEEGKQGGTINDLAIHGIDLVRYITGLGISRVLSARCWNAYARAVPHFKDSAQFMVELDGGAGLIADVSYSMPKVKGFSPKQTWRFTIWGEKGILEFNCADNLVELTLNGEEKLKIIKNENSASNPMCDFLADIECKGRELDTQNVIKSTRDTLLIQQASL